MFKNCFLIFQFLTRIPLNCLPENSSLILVLNQFFIQNLKNIPKVSLNSLASLLEKYYIFKSDEYFKKNWEIAFQPLFNVLNISLSKMDKSLFLSLVNFPLLCKKYIYQFDSIEEIENFMEEHFQPSKIKVNDQLLHIIAKNLKSVILEVITKAKYIFK